MDKYHFNPKLCIHYVRCNVTKDCTKELCMKCRFYRPYDFKKEGE